LKYVKEDLKCVKEDPCVLSWRVLSRRVAGKRQSLTSSPAP